MFNRPLSHPVPFQAILDTATKRKRNKKKKKSGAGVAESKAMEEEA